MSDHVLVLNIGSSSIKYELLDPGTGARTAVGLVERVGDGEGRLIHRPKDGEAYERREPYPDHQAAMDAVVAAFAAAGPDLASLRLRAIGHRVVHGGTRFREPTVIDEKVIEEIEALSPLAPLHNPANVTGIRTAMRLFPDIPQVAVFDTAFHHTLPPEAYTYAVPREWAKEHGVRRYGFHGTSYAYVCRHAAKLLGRPLGELDLIVLHLGNGASAAAVHHGRSVDTSMGMTPMEGLVMGTRSGDVDPILPLFLLRELGLTPDAAEQVLSSGSGMRALTGETDMRDIWRLADAGDGHARLGLEIYARRIRKYIGAYYALLGRLDAIVFTAGVGEHDARTRAAALRGLERLGLVVDQSRNEAASTGARAVSPPGAEVAVLVVPTDEEAEIAAEALAVLGSNQRRDQ
ncbi:acetate/propionate family kinase [Sinosporangium siamense]|uniref:Acetate kinase n=1 Tax=Sinosporangium siamense TaxID=1367973 RepID=A0A919V4N6_9ACTN|nr:acetate kinase [Sinosporangium siamense]GII92115.1 acetate kinase [Sinosporangium siamense]